ncbi:MAG: hypothetical protein JXO44_06800 [Clostridia bacterium]|nr:hypothetical protein [Clostridia bacterium]
MNEDISYEEMLIIKDKRRKKVEYKHKEHAPKKKNGYSRKNKRDYNDDYDYE